MSYNVVFSPAEDIIGAVDAVLAKSQLCTKEFVSSFADISITQAENALFMATQLKLIDSDQTTSTFSSNSYISRMLVTSRDSNSKAALFRFVLEQYEPFAELKKRYLFCGSIDKACKQVVTLFDMSCSYKDLKNTMIDIATFSKAMINDGASTYKFNLEGESFINVLNRCMNEKETDELQLREILGDYVFHIIDYNSIVQPLADALSKSNSINADAKSIILYSGNSFESFLQQIAVKHKLSLTGKNGIIQKSDALSTILSKKHRGMINYIGQIRNAADHGADVDEGGNIWEISDLTVKLYPLIVATLIKGIILRDDSRELII